jgi:chromosome partitioning protein
MNRVIAVANEKGGVGKTATAVNLGASVARAGFRVLIVDMDPQFNASRALGLDASQIALSTYDLLKAPKAGKAEAAIQATGCAGLDIIPAHPDLAGADIELVNQLGRENRLKRALAPVLDAYDVVLLDTPPSLSLLTINVFACAKEVLIPCQTHPHAFDALAELFDTIEAIQDEINPELMPIGIVATFFDSRTRVSRRILERLKSHERYADLLLGTVVRINTAIAESSDVGRPVAHFKPASSGAADYQSLAQELLNGKRPASEAALP